MGEAWQPFRFARVVKPLSRTREEFSQWTAPEAWLYLQGLSDGWLQMQAKAWEDNETMVNVVLGRAEIGQEKHRTMLTEARQSVSRVTEIAGVRQWTLPIVSHVPRSVNWLADAMSKLARAADVPRCQIWLPLDSAVRLRKQVKTLHMYCDGAGPEIPNTMRNEARQGKCGAAGVIVLEFHDRTCTPAMAWLTPLCDSTSVDAEAVAMSTNISLLERMLLSQQQQHWKTECMSAIFGHDGSEEEERHTIDLNDKIAQNSAPNYNAHGLTKPVGVADTEGAAQAVQHANGCTSCDTTFEQRGEG